MAIDVIPLLKAVFKSLRMLVGQDVKNLLTDVVSVGLIVGPGITEPNYQPGITLRQRLALLQQSL